MSGNNKPIIPQRKLGTALRSFFDHVTSHDEEGVHAALCMVANAAPAEPGAPEQINGVPVVPMHICNFGAGDPDALAQMMVMAIDTMIEEVPGFEKAWVDALRAKRLQSLITSVLGVVKDAKEKADEAKGMEAVKPEVDALIAKLKGNPAQCRDPTRNSEDNMTERSEIHTIEAGDDAAFIARASQAFDEVKNIDPANLQCLLLCAVTKDNEVKVGILGSDMDIAKMLITVTTVARNGVVQANSPSNPTNEVPQ